jgi:hypothetical protein
MKYHLSQPLQSHRDITEILLKVALNIINLTLTKTLEISSQNSPAIIRNRNLR